MWFSGVKLVKKNVCVGCHDISWKVVSGSVSPHICAVDHVAG